MSLCLGVSVVNFSLAKVNRRDTEDTEATELGHHPVVDKEQRRQRHEDTGRAKSRGRQYGIGYGLQRAKRICQQLTNGRQQLPLHGLGLDAARVWHERERVPDLREVQCCTLVDGKPPPILRPPGNVNVRACVAREKRVV